MRVMQLTTDLRLSGAEQVVLGLVRDLRRRGIETAVAGLMEGRPHPGRLRAILEREGVEAHCAHVEHPLAAWRLGGLRAYVRRWAPDVLHCHQFHANAAGLVLRRTGLRCPMIWTHHVVERRWRPARTAFYRVFRSAPEAHVFVSEAVKAHHRELRAASVPREVIHNGIELGPFLAVERRPAARGTVYGAVGRLARQKGFDVLVRAFAELHAEAPEARLRIAGDGPERGRLERLIFTEGLQGAVELPGFAEDVPGFLSGTDVFVMPSRWEGFGLTLLEALAAGLPCIASRVDSLPEVGGEFVKWVEPDDVEGLLAAMRETSHDPPPADRLVQQRQAVTRFSTEAMAEAYVRIYRAVLGDGEPAGETPAAASHG